MSKWINNVIFRFDHFPEFSWILLLAELTIIATHSCSSEAEERLVHFLKFTSCSDLKWLVIWGFSFTNLNGHLMTMMIKMMMMTTMMLILMIWWFQLLWSHISRDNHIHANVGFRHLDCHLISILATNVNITKITITLCCHKRGWMLNCLHCEIWFGQNFCGFNLWQNRCGLNLKLPW